MIPDATLPKDEDGFTLRGISVGRIEAFSDVVFGFALTLIVVSVEVPKSFDALHMTLRGFLPFALCFALLGSIWHSHYQFFRRYSLHDGVTIRINFALLFVVMFYVYPLKFLFTLATVGGQMLMSPRELTYLMLLFGVGFTAISGTDKLGRSAIWNNAIQVRLGKFVWVEDEFNSTFYKGGKNDGRQQTFATPGIIVSRIPLIRGAGGQTDPLAISLGAGEQIALTHFNTYNHAPIFTARLRF